MWTLFSADADTVAVDTDEGKENLLGADVYGR